MARYRVLTGGHQDDTGRNYVKGDIVECKQDLCALYNTQLGAKFAEVSEEEMEMIDKQKARRAEKNKTATPSGPDTLDSMSAQELRAHAAAEEIDLGNAQSKTDMIKIIRSAG